MSTEQFQRIVLEELQSLKKGQEEMKQEQQGMKQEQQEMKQELQEMKQVQQEMKQEQQEMKKSLDAVIEQTANLTEFKEEISQKLDTLQIALNAVEMIVAKNWSDIVILKAAR